MKIGSLTVISFLFSISSFFLSERTLVQNIPVNHHLVIVKTTLPGAVEVVISNDLDIRIETTIFFESNEKDALDYTIDKGYFDLITNVSFDEETLTIGPKRINTTILTKGKKYQPQRQYRIYLPSHLKYME